MRTLVSQGTHTANPDTTTAALPAASDAFTPCGMANIIYPALTKGGSPRFTTKFHSSVPPRKGMSAGDFADVECWCKAPPGREDFEKYRRAKSLKLANPDTPIHPNQPTSTCQSTHISQPQHANPPKSANLGTPNNPLGTSPTSSAGAKPRRAGGALRHANPPKSANLDTPIHPNQSTISTFNNQSCQLGHASPPKSANLDTQIHPNQPTSTRQSTQISKPWHTKQYVGDFADVECWCKTTPDRGSF
jgi:hypothetical protein